MNHSAPWWRNGHNLMVLGCVALMGGLLFINPDNLSGAGWLLLLACPLMHLFMMRSHGGCHDKTADSDSQKPAADKPAVTSGQSPSAPAKHQH